MDQAHVVDHQSGQEMDQKRSVLHESARIFRAPVKPLSELKASSAEAVVFPGGFGAAKNLSDFGFKGADMTVNAEVSRVLKDFRSADKPIALCCISPIVAAKVFGSEGVKVCSIALLKRPMRIKKHFFNFSDHVRQTGRRITLALWRLHRRREIIWRQRGGKGGVGDLRRREDEDSDSSGLHVQWKVS